MPEAREWEAVIGMEVHAHLKTASKMFCGCGTDYLGKPPNSNVCPVCLGLPGVLPVINRQAVELCLKSALALNCEIQPSTKFDRKNYFYPDLPKGYQISQYDLPMSRNGWLEVDGRRVGITRVHLEEDTGRLVHAGDRLESADRSYVDLNRSGMPLMEVVSEPDLRSAAEARDFAMALRGILRAVGVGEADMEKGQLRAEANVSIRQRGSDELGVKTELKNINSFRALFNAVEYEIKRQARELDAGREIVQETRGWSEPERRTFSQRSKEVAQDYRYFPEPDLPPLAFAPAWIAELRSSLPELPAARRERLVSEHGLSEYQARLLAGDLEVADYFEELVRRGLPAQPAANWLIGEMLPRDEPLAVPVAETAELLTRLGAAAINREQARAVLDQLYETGKPVAELAAGLEQISDASALAGVIDTVLAANPQAVADFKAGKEAAVGPLVGKVMQATGGSANPKLARDLLLERLRR